MTLHIKLVYDECTLKDFSFSFNQKYNRLHWTEIFDIENFLDYDALIGSWCIALMIQSWTEIQSYSLLLGGYFEGDIMLPDNLVSYEHFFTNMYKTEHDFLWKNSEWITSLVRVSFGQMGLYHTQFHRTIVSILRKRTYIYVLFLFVIIFPIVLLKYIKNR